MKILVIEDEIDLQQSIKESLVKEDYLVETASDYHSAIEKVFVYQYDCILLDIMLPHGSGLDILDELKQAGKTEISSLFQPEILWMTSLKAWSLGQTITWPNPFTWLNLMRGLRQC